jgi:hypothetical protein
MFGTGHCLQAMTTYTAVSIVHHVKYNNMHISGVWYISVFTDWWNILGSLQRNYWVTVHFVSYLSDKQTDIDHYLVGVNVKERLAVSKRETHSFSMEISIIKELNESRVKNDVS